MQNAAWIAGPAVAAASGRRRERVRKPPLRGRGPRPPAARHRAQVAAIGPDRARHNRLAPGPGLRAAAPPPLRAAPPPRPGGSVSRSNSVPSAPAVALGDPAEMARVLRPARQASPAAGGSRAAPPPPSGPAPRRPRRRRRARSAASPPPARRSPSGRRGPASGRGWHRPATRTRRRRPARARTPAPGRNARRPRGRSAPRSARASRCRSSPCARSATSAAACGALARACRAARAARRVESPCAAAAAARSSAVTRARVDHGGHVVARQEHRGRRRPAPSGRRRLHALLAGLAEPGIDRDGRLQREGRRDLPHGLLRRGEELEGPAGPGHVRVHWIASVCGSSGRTAAP